MYTTLPRHLRCESGSYGRMMVSGAADSTMLLVAAIFFWLVSHFIMMTQCQSLKDASGDGIDIPDVWFGCTDDALYKYLHKLGPQGRRAYTNINTLDFLIYMPSYAILLRTLLLRQCRWAGVSTKISWICIVVLMSDIIESFIFRYATRQFPNRLDSNLLLVASIANQGKWVSLLLGTLTLAALGVRNYYVAVVGNGGGTKRHPC